MSYPTSIDCVWLALDSEHNVGVFITAGVAPIPKEVLKSKTSILDTEEQVWLLPKVSECKLLVQVNKPDDYEELAKRGMYVFDWCDVHRTIQNYSKMYELVASPTVAVKCSSLPNNFSDLIFSGFSQAVNFSKQTRIDAATLVECEAAL